MQTCASLESGALVMRLREGPLYRLSISVQEQPGLEMQSSSWTQQQTMTIGGSAKRTLAQTRERNIIIPSMQYSQLRVQGTWPAQAGFCPGILPPANLTRHLAHRSALIPKRSPARLALITRSVTRQSNAPAFLRGLHFTTLLIKQN